MIEDYSVFLHCKRKRLCMQDEYYYSGSGFYEESDRLKGRRLVIL